jgi:hypothetical protein
MMREGTQSIKAIVFNLCAIHSTRPRKRWGGPEKNDLLWLIMLLKVMMSTPAWISQPNEEVGLLFMTGDPRLSNIQLHLENPNWREIPENPRDLMYRLLLILHVVPTMNPMVRPQLFLAPTIPSHGSR